MHIIAAGEGISVWNERWYGYKMVKTGWKVGKNDNKRTVVLVKSTHKFNISRIGGGVLEILIPKTIDKKVFMGYNVNIVYKLFLNE